MTSPLMKSVSGIRGIVGESLTPEVIYKTAIALARFTKRGAIVIGRDTRPTGVAIANGIQSILLLSGCNVIDIGMVPTPTVQVMVEELHADGGVVISASHNPVQWNAFKLISNEGTFLDSKQIGRFFRYMDSDLPFVKWDAIGTLERNDSAEQIHINKVLGAVNSQLIKKKKFTVVLDSVNGAGSLITPRLLEELGCRVIPIYSEPDGIFPRGAEPLAENLTMLSKQVVRYRADIGFAQDPDADRLAIVDERGRPIGEEYTIVLVADHLLSKEKGNVVVNLSTTKAVDDVARKYGVNVIRSRVGEINVVREMKKRGARIGGEGNGGVIAPDIHYGRDSLAGISYVLEMMAERQRSISELVSGLPFYVMMKGKVSFDPKRFNASVIQKITNSVKDEKVSAIDGLRIEFRKNQLFKGGWVHLRSSNTEPIFRIIAEGRDEKQARAIYRHFAAFIRM